MAKYNFGETEIDLLKYIHNLGTNVLNFVESQNWNQGLKDEFAQSFNKMLESYKELLANDSGRFSTDSLGAITDSTGLYNNGVTSYYDTNGTKIDENAYNQLDENSKKNYKAFNANLQVAKFFNYVGRAIAKQGGIKKEEKGEDKFDITKHGFMNYFTQKYNPAGGQTDLTPFLNKDAYNEETGKRERTNRAKLMATDLQEYLDGLKSYDFSESTYGSRDKYIQDINNALTNLNNGNWNDDDLLALQRIGVTPDFYNGFFTEDKNPNVTPEQVQLEIEEKKKKEAAEDLERRKNEYIDSQLGGYNNFSNTQGFRGFDNPYILRDLNQYFDEAGNWNRELFQKSFKLNDPANAKYMNVGTHTFNYDAYINDYLTNPEKTFSDEGKRAVAAMIGAGYAKPISSGKYQGMYYISNKYNEDNNKNAALIYDDSTGKLFYGFIGDIPEAWNERTTNWLNLNNPADVHETYKFKEGGQIPQHQMGGGFSFNNIIENDRNKDLAARAGSNDQKAIKAEKAREREMLGEKTALNPDNGFSKYDILRLSAIGADLTSMVVSLCGGNVGAAGVGAAGTTANFIADLEDGFLWKDVRNALLGYGMDALSIIPGGGFVKGGKAIKGFVKYAPKIALAIGTMVGVANAGEITNSLSKVVSDPTHLNVRDYQNIAQAILLVTGGAIAGKNFHNRPTTVKDSVAVPMLDKNGNKQMVGFVGEDAKAIKAAQSKGDVEALKKATIGKYDKFDGWDLETSSSTKTLYGGFRDEAGNRRLNPFERVETEKPKTYTVLQTKNGVYFVEEGMLGDSWYFGGPRPSNNPKRGTVVSSNEKTIDLVVEEKRQNIIDELKTAHEGRVNDINANEKAMKDYLSNEGITPERYKNAVTQGRLAVAFNKKNPIDAAQLQARTAYEGVKAQNEAQIPILESRVKQLPALELKLKNPNNYTTNKKGRHAREALNKQKAEDLALFTLLKQEEATLNLLKAEKANWEAYDLANPDWKTYQSKLDVINDFRKLTSGTYQNLRETSKHFKNTHTDAYNKYQLLLTDGEIKLDPRSDATLKWDDIVKSILGSSGGTLYKQGGQINYNNLREIKKAGGVIKAQSGIKVPEWYSKRWKDLSLPGWSSALDHSLAGSTITSTGAGHGNAGDLGMAYQKNDAYINQLSLVGSDIQNYYNNNFKGKSLEEFVNQYNSDADTLDNYWKGNVVYNALTAAPYNLLFKKMFNSRSGEGNDIWDIGYLEGQEKTLGSSTWLRRMDNYEDPFNMLSDRIHKINLGDGKFGYVGKSDTGRLIILNDDQILQYLQLNPEPIIKKGIITPAGNDTNPDSNEKVNIKMPVNPFDDLTAIYGIPRWLADNRTNLRMTRLQMLSHKPYLQDPNQFQRYIQSDLDSENNGLRTSGTMHSLASRPMTSDGQLQTAAMLEAESKGLQAVTQGLLASNVALRQSKEAALQQEKENKSNLHLTAMQNRLAQLQAFSNKNLTWASYLALKQKDADTLSLQFEYDAKVKLAEQKQYADLYATKLIQDAVLGNPSAFADLTDDELSLFINVNRGTIKPSSLNDELQAILQSALKKVQEALNKQMMTYHGIKDTPWANVRRVAAKLVPYGENSVVIEKNGGQVEAAKIKAKTADADRFEKSIEKKLERHRKALDRIAKSLYGYTKHQVVK